MHNFCHTHNIAKLLIVLVWGVFLVPFVVEAGDGGPLPTYQNYPATVPAPPVDPGITYQSIYSNLSTGFPSQPNNFQVIGRDEYCLISQSDSVAHFVPTKHAAGWQSFLNNTPVGTVFDQCVQSSDCRVRTQVTSPGTLVFGGHCYLDTDRRPKCLEGTFPGFNREGTLIIDPVPGFENARYLEYLYDGTSAACGIKEDLTISCTDYVAGASSPFNDHAQRKVLDHPHGQYVDIALGNTSGCALGVDKEIDCWGFHADFCVGVQNCTVYQGELNPPSGKFKWIESYGGSVYCALRDTDSSIQCWGDTVTSADIPDNFIYPPVGAYRLAMVFSAYNGSINEFSKMICGVDNAGNFVCPSTSQLQSSGFTSLSINAIRTFEAQGPFQDVVKGGTSGPFGARMLNLYNSNTDKLYFLSTSFIPNANTGNFVWGTEIFDPGWDEPASMYIDGWVGDANNNYVSARYCGFIGNSVSCVAQDGTPNTPVEIQQRGSFWANSFCSTL